MCWASCDRNMSWNLVKTWSWNFTSCCWDPWKWCTDCEQSCVEGRTRSSARGNLVVQRTRTKFGERVQRHGTSYRAASATLHPWTVSRRLWKHFCFYLISECTLHLHCCMQRIFSIGLWFVRRAPLNRSPCYGAVEIVVTLLLLSRHSRPSVCLSPKCKKTQFSQKLSTGFSKNPLLDP